MHYRIKTVILKRWPYATYIQNYTEGLVLANEWKYCDYMVSYLRYDVATDGVGSVYFKDNNAIKKYLENGVFIASKYLPTLYSITPLVIGPKKPLNLGLVNGICGKPLKKYYSYHGIIRDCLIECDTPPVEEFLLYGKGYIYYLQKVSSSYRVGILNAFDLSSAGGSRNLTPGKIYKGLVVSDEGEDDFFTFNATDYKIEKWNRLTGKIKEKVIGSGYRTNTLAVAGNNIMGGSGTSKYWITNDELDGPIVGYDIKDGATPYLYAVCLCISNIDNEFFLMVFKAGNLGEPIRRYIRKCDVLGNTINTKVIDTSEYNIVVCTK